MHILQSRVLVGPDDFDASVEFYERRLGLTRYREWGGRGHRGVVFFLGGGYLELNEAAGGPRPAGVRLWVQVTDVEATSRELDAAGVVIDEPPQRKPWGLIEMAVHDPDGLPLVVVEVPADHPLRRDTRG